MFKLQHYLLILTFSPVQKNQKGHYQNYFGGHLPPPLSGDDPGEAIEVIELHGNVQIMERNYEKIGKFS